MSLSLLNVAKLQHAWLSLLLHAINVGGRIDLLRRDKMAVDLFFCVWLLRVNAT
jgi:hypothetical protein